MNRIKHFLLLVCIAGCFAACKKDEVPPFDYLGQFKTDTTAIRNFINENNIPALKDEPTGVFYQILEPGADVSINGISTVTADYEGRFLDGTVFDSSQGTPITFVLQEAIPGWEIGLSYIKKGGKIRLIIPSYYAYGNVANQRIPANSILDFTITVTDVN